MEGNFTLHVSDKNAVLTYSFVGFQTERTKGTGEFTVKLEQKVYQINQLDKRSSATDSGDKMSAEQLEKEKQLNEKMKKEQLEKEKEMKDEVSEEQPEKEKKLRADMKEEDNPGKDKELFYFVEDMPKFQGRSPEACLDFIQEHLKYPAGARQKGLEGKVIVRFAVGANGEVKDARVKRGVDPLLDSAALDAVNAMPAWEPGKQRGKPVKVIFEVPVIFRAGGD